MNTYSVNDLLSWYNYSAALFSTIRNTDACTVVEIVVPEKLIGDGNNACARNGILRAMLSAQASVSGYFPFRFSLPGGLKSPFYSPLLVWGLSFKWSSVSMVNTLLPPEMYV